MDNSLGRIAGLAAFALMLARLGLLLHVGAEAPAWQMIMIASAFLGGVIWWLLTQILGNRRIVIGLFALAGLALFLRISVSHTLVLGFLPGGETLGALGREMSDALDLIRYGEAPVFPTSGIIGLLSILMWVIGALYVWGATEGPSIAMMLPSFGLYLQFAVMDRVPAGLAWMIAAATVIALSVASISIERRQEAGRVRDLDGRPLARRAGSMAVVVALIVAFGSVLTADNASSLVPQGGNIRWRFGSGYGSGLGGVSFDRLADLRQSIIRRTNAVLFRATLDPNAPPPEEIRWRMESLDVFDGIAWRPVTQADFYEPGSAGGNPAYAYQGTTQEITQRVQIAALRSQVLPTAGIGQFFRSDSVNVSGFQITPDGSVIYQAGLDEGDEYEVQAVLPMSRQDLGALATMGRDGTLSPLFASAAEAGVTSIEPGSPPGDVEAPSDIGRFVDLPPEMPAGLLQLARQKTAGATTPFEAAWLLQRWFRDSDEFDYSTDVSTGHGSLDLEEWLTDPDSLNYKTGYCEQFAAAMAVLGRLVLVPSRVVVGFTPGSVEQQSDGTEVTEVIVVRDHNAHAWVEMWIDGFGWVEFDPTPRGDGTLPESITAEFDPTPFLPPPGSDFPFIQRPGFFDESITQFDRLPPTDVGSGRGLLPFELDWVWGVVVALVLVVGSIPLLKGIRRRRRMKLLRQGDITAAWDEIVDRLGDLGSPVPPYQTPLEFAHATDRSLVHLASSYSAAVYGDRNGQGRESDLRNIETWLKVHYQGRTRTRAAFNPRSLLRRN